MILRRSVPVLLLLALAAAGRPAAAAERPPNFVVVLIDDMGYGDVGPFGSKVNRTPNLDRMAREGMTLTSFYGAPLCTASRSQIMTGCYAKRVSMPNVLSPVSATGLGFHERTIAELLRPRGYATACFGKWHLGDQPPYLPTHRGFDHYLGLPYSNDMLPSNRPGSRTPPLPLVRDDRVIEVVTPEGQDQLTRRYTEAAVQFLRDNKDHPFFLYLPHTAVHVPIHPGPEFKGKSRNGRYGDWVEQVDWSVGRVLDTLRELKLEDNTLVFFTSDNGPWLQKGHDAGSAGPLRDGKGTTWEGGMREPALARWPGKIAAGSRCDAVAASLDLLPTLVKLAGGTVPTERPIDGRDIWPLLSGAMHESPHEALYYFLGQNLEAVRSGPWKLRLAGASDGVFVKKRPGEPPAPARLYNLDADIGDKTDVAARHPDVVRRLAELADRMDADLGKTGHGPGVRPAAHVKDPQPLRLGRAQAEALRPRTLAEILRTLEDPRWETGD
ncbi:MAG TPA: sulfatase [Gemmataceae bacterium]|nr:sulfatase [Gemmataceae bacterium]